MLTAAILAIILANTNGAGFYDNFTDLTKHIVNDWLMVIFFLAIALELKAEMFGGMLSNFKQILLPLLAAIGGMAVPALIYTQLNSTSGALRGWAIPTATDIAFALSILLIFGRKLPPSLKIFLLAIAIFDDLGAIGIIAFFYSDTLAMLPLGFAVLTIAALFMLNNSNNDNPKVYLLLGTLLAFLLHKTGIHTTIAGVITGLMIPKKCNKKLMHELHPYTTFIIVPIFAFVNAGISFGGITIDHLFNRITLGIAFGLFIGKQIGIFGMSYIAIKSKLAILPKDATWRDIHIISVIAGIGFTMSLFISILAFPEDFMQEEAKFGVILGSALSALLGILLLRLRKNLQ